MTNEGFEAIPTRWSLIKGALKGGKSESAVEMQRQLVLRYAPAIKRYVGAIVRDRDDAEELAQDFLLRLMRGDFAGAEPHKGRFRDLLKTAIRNMIKNHWEKSNRRRTAHFDVDLVNDGFEQEQDAKWTHTWQKAVLDHTWARMLAQDGGTPSSGYVLLKLRVEFPEASSNELAEWLSQKIGSEVKPDGARQILRRARVRFAQNLIDEIRSGIDDESDQRVQEELGALGLLEWVKDYWNE